MWSGSFDFGKLGETLQQAAKAAESQLGGAIAIAKAEANKIDKALLSHEEKSQAGERDHLGWNSCCSFAGTKRSSEPSDMSCVLAPFI